MRTNVQGSGNLFGIRLCPRALHCLVMSTNRHDHATRQQRQAMPPLGPELETPLAATRLHHPGPLIGMLQRQAINHPD
jgi:hypothetical protein